MVEFHAQVAVEGRKSKTNRGLRLTVPAEAARELRAAGCTFPGWLRIALDGSEPVFAGTRWVKSRPYSHEITVPSWRYPDIRRGNEVLVSADRAEPWRAKPGGDGFDWLPFVADAHYFTADDGADLVLWNRHEPPFRLRRRPPEVPTYRLLGLYQAEGSKSVRASDFSLANTNAKLLGAAVDMLGSWGIGRERLSTEIVRPTGYDAAVARGAFMSLGVEIVAERERKAGDAGTEPAATLHARRSMPLLRLTRAALARIFAEDFPTKEAAREFALGWLDGDGSITLNGNHTELRLAGHDDEQQVVLRALHHGFGWRKKGGSFGGVRHHTARTLDVREAAELAVAGAFPVSMNRARLLYGLATRLEGLRRHTSRWPPENEAEARRLFATLAQEMETLRRLLPPERLGTGEKGLPYPLEITYPFVR